MNPLTVILNEIKIIQATHASPHDLNFKAVLI